MNDAAKSALDKLGTIGILALVGAGIAFGLVLWASGDVAGFGVLILGPLGLIGVVFTAAWLLGVAVVGQLSDDS
jgi:hypothetical protein